MPDDAVKAYANDAASAIVALTHDPRIDDMGLMQALKTPAFYVGAMGSVKTSAGRRKRLSELDVTDCGTGASARADRSADRQQNATRNRHRDPRGNHRRAKTSANARASEQLAGLTSPLEQTSAA